MSDLSRRALVAALPAVALPVPLALAAALPVTNAAILAGMELDLARIARDINAMFPPNVDAFRRFNNGRRGWHVPCQTDTSARGRYRHDRSQERWRERLAQLREDCGLAATEGRISDLREERDGIIERAGHIRATDLASLKAKARMAEYTNGILASLAADVRSMEAL